MGGTLLAPGGRCRRCIPPSAGGRRLSAARYVVRLMRDGEYFELPLCQRCADELDRALDEWLRLATEVDPPTLGPAEPRPPRGPAPPPVVFRPARTGRVEVVEDDEPPRPAIGLIEEASGEGVLTFDKGTLRLTRAAQQQLLQQGVDVDHIRKLLDPRYRQRIERPGGREDTVVLISERGLQIVVDKKARQIVAIAGKGEGLPDY